MARQATLAPAAPMPEINLELARQDIVDTHVIQENAQALALQLGYDGSLTVGALEDEIRFYQRRSVEAVLELGKRLLILKEMTPHGEFIQRVDLLGINERMARRFMSATLKFSKTDKKSVLTAAGTQSKLLELLVLDDGEIQELADGGSVRGLTLDEIETMTVSDLKAALREARENAQVKERQLEAKDRKINELDAKLSKPASEPVYDEAEALRALDHAALEAVAGVHARLRKAAFDLMGERPAHGLPRTLRQAIAAALGRVSLAVADLGEELDIPASESSAMDQGVDPMDAVWAATNADMDALAAQEHDGPVQ